MDRVSRLLNMAGVASQDAILIHKPSNIYFLSGYSGEGLLLLTRDISAIITDFRYTEQAGQQAPSFQVYEISTGKSHIQVAADVLQQAGIHQLYYEDDHVTVVQFATMGKAMPGMTFTPIKEKPEQLRKVKDESEIAVIRKACGISVQAFDYILTVITEGMTEREVQLKLDFKMLELGAEGLAFSTILASGENGSLPHAVPTSRRLQKGDLITLDFGAKYGGYCSDMTRTIALGQPSEEMRKVYDIVLQAQMAAQEALMPGKVCRDIDAIARDIITQAGYGKNFGHGLGHSVGIDIHEMPRLNQTCEEVVEPGIVITVEPGIYLPAIGGVRIENTCLVTENGAQSLVSAPRELIIL